MPRPDRAKKKEPLDRIAIEVLPPSSTMKTTGAAKSDDTMDYDTPHILKNFQYVHSHAIAGAHTLRCPSHCNHSNQMHHSLNIDHIH